MSPVRIWAKLQSQTRPEWLIEFPTYRPKAVPITIGRNPACTLCLQENLTISNRHVMLETKDLSNGKRTVVLHESSSNGTEIMGKLYSKGSQVTLIDGMQIAFPVEEGKHVKSDFTFVFTEIEDDDESAEEVESSDETTKLLMEELQAIQLQCDSLAVEASRLCASTMKPSNKNSDLESVTLLLLESLQHAHQRLRDMGSPDDEGEENASAWEQHLERLGVL